MVVAENQAKLSDLRHFISQVPAYPVSVKRLLSLARQRRTNKEVINFYRSFPETTVFTDRDDMEARSEAVEIMQTQNEPAEDEVRGAED